MTSRIWSGKHHGPKVCDSLDPPIGQLVVRVPGEDIDLVGYAGGGARAG